jgi:hypothetical protein
VRDQAASLSWTRLFVTAAANCAIDSHQLSYAARGIEVLNEAIPRYPDHPELLNKRAHLHLVMSDLEAAKADYNIVIARVRSKIDRGVGTSVDRHALDEARQNLATLEGSRASE